MAALISLDTLVRDFCVVVHGDMNQEQYVRVARAMRIVLEEIHLHAIPYIQSREFTISDSLTVALPADCVKPTQVGVMNSSGNIESLGQDLRIRRTYLNNIDNPVSCDNPDYDQELSNPSAPAAESLIFFNFANRDGFVGELYGLRARQHVNGTWRWNQAEGVIEFGSGEAIWSGNTVIVEYKSDFGEDIHKMIPKQWQQAINYRTLQMLTASSNPRASQAHFQQFKTEYFTVKRYMQHKSPEQLQAIVDEARYGAVKF